MNKQPKRYTNNKPPYMDKAWQYNQYSSVLDRFKAMGWVAPSEQKGTKTRAYIVWVGGCSMYEGRNKDKAMLDFNVWVEQGYDDVILEEIEQ